MLRRIYLLLAIAALFALIAGCGRELELATLANQPLQITAFHGGRQMNERSVSPPSREHELLAALAARHKTGWKHSYVTFAPGISVRGTNFTLNIQSSRAILNIDGHQYVRAVPASDFDFLSR